MQLEIGIMRDAEHNFDFIMRFQDQPLVCCTNFSSCSFFNLPSSYLALFQSFILFQVSEVRSETRAEKKRLAMAMRQKQLGALGMKVQEWN